MAQALRSIALVIGGAIMVFNWHEALAQTTAASTDNEPNSLSTIIVTAEKREERLQDVPMSVTALSGGSLDKLQDRDFSDYAALVPGLSLVSAQSGLTRLTLRGQNAGGVGSTVAVYMDESPFGSSSALLNGSTNTGDFDTWDLQRIEVLRGPQGTLYGANSEGGLLKFVSNAPVLNSFSGAAEATGEAVAHGGKGGDVRAMVNLPVGDNAAFRLSGFDEDVPGYIDDPTHGKRDLNDGHKYGGRASFLAVPTDNLTIRLTASSQQTKYNGTNAVDVNPVTLVPVHGDLTQERSLAEPSSFKYENYNATIDWNAGPFRILSTTSYGVLKSAAPTDYTALLNGALGATVGGYLSDNVELKKLTQELRVSSAASDRLEWQVGGYFTRETGQLIEHLDAVNLPSGSLDTDFPPLEDIALVSAYKEWAGFGNLTYHFNTQFDLEAGGRWSTNKQTSSESITGLLAKTGTEIPGADSKGHVFTYSVAPRWHVDANTMVYARLSTGYRPGGPNVIAPLSPADVPRTYGADKTVNVELGTRSTLLDGQLSIDVAAFHVDWKDIQLLEVVDNTGINANGGKARSQGLEWTFGLVPVRGLKFAWIGAYTDAKLTSPAPALNGMSGDRLPYAPKWSTSLDGEYEWDVFANYRGFLGATWSYIGSRSSDFGSSPGAVPGQVVLPSYNTTEARVGVENDRYRVTLFGKNLSDSRGITNYLSGQAPGPAGELAVIRPRTIGLTLSAKF